MKLKIAGNTNVGCVRNNNEDNFCVSADLQAGLFANASCPWGAEQVVDLGDKGVLLVVADGMGGTNAGEVASERAVTKAAQFFAPERITDAVTASAGSILAFMEQAIVACDKEVKGWGDSHPESKGMGTTMVMGWILGGKLYVAWCGDSRAYVYRPGENKIYQVSKDHSYVQLLVDKAMLSREETFDHPQGNIITRSLSHGQPAARPESLPEPYQLCDGDIVLLCSDGLSGMLHDQEMADVISNSPDDGEQIVTNLINAARQAGGSDNITAVLCKVENGGKGTDATSKAFFAVTEAALDGPGMDAEPQPTPLFPDEPAPAPAPARPSSAPDTYVPQAAQAQAPAPKKSDKKTLISVIATLAVLIVCAGGWFAFNKSHKPAVKDAITQADTHDPAKPGEPGESIDQDNDEETQVIEEGKDQPTHPGEDEAQTEPVPTSPEQQATSSTINEVPLEVGEDSVDVANLVGSINDKIASLHPLNKCSHECTNNGKQRVKIYFNTNTEKDSAFNKTKFRVYFQRLNSDKHIMQLLQLRDEDKVTIDTVYYYKDTEVVIQPDNIVEEIINQTSIKK